MTLGPSACRCKLVALADNTQVTTRGEDHALSDRPYVDFPHVKYAVGLHLWQAKEVYMPARTDFADEA